jgi:iron(III) transport system substrate-binding protein
MRAGKLSRRDVLKASGAAAMTVFATPLRAAPPEPTAITPALVEAATREGKVIYYTPIDLPVSERIAKAFEAKFPGIAVRVERTGAERVFQRIGQEYASNIHAVEDVAKYYPADQKDPDGQFASFRVCLSVIGYNTNLVKGDPPKSFADLLDPKWAGKIVKGHPGYSGTIMTATYEMARDLGWDYFEKLAKQRVMQVQSASDPPKKVGLGERAIMADGNDYVLTTVKDAGAPVEIVYPAEGAPQIIGPNAVFKAAPNPNAARLFQAFCFTAECQQLVLDVANMHSFHPLVKEKPGRKPFREIKVMKEDAAAVEREAEQIKARYTKIFRV